MSKATRIEPNPLDPLPITFYVHSGKAVSFKLDGITADTSQALFGTCPLSDVLIIEADLADHCIAKIGRTDITITTETAGRLAEALGIQIESKAVAA